MSRAVFFDRDGVLNKAVVRNGNPHPPKNLDELEIDPDALLVTSSLKEMGFKLFVFTNQPDVARGKFSRETVYEINEHIQETLGLNEIAVCFHDDKDNCTCRKPKAGMLTCLAEKHQVMLEASYVVGDRLKDISAGKKVKCKTIFINQFYAEPPPTEHDYEIYKLIQVLNVVS